MRLKMLYKNSCLGMFVNVLGMYVFENSTSVVQLRFVFAYLPSESGSTLYVVVPHLVVERYLVVDARGDDDPDGPLEDVRIAVRLLRVSPEDSEHLKERWPSWEWGVVILLVPAFPGK
jgi:hypothetical protein